MIDKIKNSPLNLQATSVYNFNEFSLPELLNKFFTTINQCVDVSNTSLDFLTWLKGEGLPNETIKELNNMYNNGKLTQLIDNMSGNLNGKIEDNRNEMLEYHQKIDKIIDSDLPYMKEQMNEIVILTSNFKTEENTWQEAIQNTINFVETLGGGKVLLPPGKTIELIKKGEKDCSFGDTTFKQSYCLEIGSNVHLDLNGSKLILANMQNSSLIINKSILYTHETNKKITITNGTLDSNCSNQTNPIKGTLDCITFINCNEITLTDLRFDNCRDSAFRIMKSENSFFDNLYCSYSDGDGFRFGPHTLNGTYDQSVKNSMIGTIQADNCMVNRNGTLQGNPIIASLKNCSISQIRSFGCGGGYKFQDGCINLSIGRLIFNGALERDIYNSSTNSGVKIQGGGGLNPNNVTIGEIIATDCGGYGLYIEHTTNVTVGSFIGGNNALEGNYSDIRIGNSSSIIIDNIISNNSGGASVVIREDTTNYHLGNVNIINPGEVVNNVGLLINGNKGHITSLITKDTRATKKMTYGLSVVGSDIIGTVEYFESDGYLTEPFKFDSNGFEIKKALFDYNSKTTGSVTLSSGTTSTVISTLNAKGINRGDIGRLVPIIEIIPVNASARLLTSSINYVVSTSGGFTINHTTAQGIEVFIWRINGYMLSPINIQ